MFHLAPNFTAKGPLPLLCALTVTVVRLPSASCDTQAKKWRAMNSYTFHASGSRSLRDTAFRGWMGGCACSGDKHARIGMYARRGDDT